jgi:putative membrane-bound dehydrogenase-like protein
MKYLSLLAALLFVSLTTPAWAQKAANSWGGAAWVWDEPDANKVTQNNDPRYLRRTFELSAKPLAAELWITVDNHYIVYVNGQKVGEDSEWSTVEKYDVAKHLVVGKNVLAIKATNQGGVAGAIARLYIKNSDKKNLYIVTDEKTKIRRAEPRERPGDGWLKTDFDDSSWFAAIVLGDPSIGPWNLTSGTVAGKGKKGGPTDYGSNAVDPKVKTRLSAQEQLKHFIVPKDFKIELVAADPVVINPITMVLDDKGRIIVSESHTYRYGPSGSPIKPFANPVVRLDPDGKGGFTRTLIADGFDDPVMGIAIKGDKLWLTANNFLYTYDLPPDPKPAGEQREPAGSAPKKPLAINKKAILTDKSKAWNPFGMFVLEWGPDGKLYMSVGNHGIDIHGPDGKISSRGGSGLIMRMNPDGTKMERLVHGLRVPYSFEYDPFGQLWVLSNGEGNPDRFVRVIDGVDYHCYSRPAINNEWLAGRHPLAPPCEEVHGGAHTQLLRYYAAAYPAEYQGNLFCCNWGRHGFAGANRGIFRYVLDERNNVVKKDTLVACTDPHFRPSHIHLDVDGSLLIADWYGRDDESDMTGRIWRLKYVGKDRPVVKHKLDSAEWKNDDYALEALGSPDHLIREKAMNEVATRRFMIVEKLKTHASSAKEPLGAANALWALLRITGLEGAHLEWGKIDHSDWKVRRLRVNILGRHAEKPGWHSFGAVMQLGKTLEKEKDAAVLVELAVVSDRIFRNNAGAPAGLVHALTNGAAADVHLRYEAAWHLASHVDEKAITQLLTSDDANVRLAGLIAIDVACYENFPTKKFALEALAKALENPGKLDHQLLLMVAQLDGDASIVPALEKLIARDDLPTATIAKAVLVLKAKSGGSLASSKLSAAAGKRLIEAVEKGSLKIASPADQLVIFEFLESEGPTPFALKQIEGQLRSNNPALKQAAHTLARRFGPKASSLGDGLWPNALNPKTKFEDTIEYLSTIARTQEANPKVESWEKLLLHEDPFVRAEAVRWWRSLKGKEGYTGLLVRTPGLIKKDASIKEDLATVYRHFGWFDLPAARDLQLPEQEKDKDALTKYAVKELAAMPAADRTKRAAMGLQIFERNSCTKCHTTATATTLLAPSLKGVAAQKVEYLIESVLYPSKIIKTGWEVENIELKNGKTLVGLVKDEGKHLRVLNLDKDTRVLKGDVESRSLSKVSVMPDGQEATLSRREFVDLIAYLQTLK